MHESQSGGLTVALKLRATSPPAQLAADVVLCPPGHKHSDSFRSDRHASLKRMVGPGGRISGCDEWAQVPSEDQSAEDPDADKRNVATAAKRRRA